MAATEMEGAAMEGNVLENKESPETPREPNVKAISIFQALDCLPQPSRLWRV